MDQIDKLRYFKLSHTILLALIFISSILSNSFILWLSALVLCLLFYSESYLLKKASREYQTLYRSAYFDSLTGIPNRQSADLYCQKHLSSKRLCAAVADLDNLKSINDTLGHTSGDQLIRDFASLFYETAAPHGFAARNGGDEFLALFEGPDPERTMRQFLLELQEAVDSHNTVSPVPLRYSIGYSSSLEGGFKDIYQLISLADRRMYQQKSQKQQISATQFFTERRSAYDKAADE